jgi:hypothetical protein
MKKKVKENQKKRSIRRKREKQTQQTRQWASEGMGKLVIQCFLFSFVVLAVLWFELRASSLLGRHSTTWSICLALFLLVILEIWGYNFLPRLVLTVILPVAGRRGMHHQAQLFFCWDRVLWTFCQGWPGTMILLISAFQVARNSDMSHWYLASNINKELFL